MPVPPLRARIRSILTLGLPIIGGMASQNILNLVDTAMVGSLGATALAAVGQGSMANWLATTFFIALGTGVQAISARRMGQDDPRGAVRALHSALLIALVAVLPYSLLFLQLIPGIFELLTDDPAVRAEGVVYMSTRMASACFLTANFAFRGYWNGIGMSSVYLRTIIVIHAANITGNLLLIHGHLGFPALGVFGAALASAIATAIGTATYVVLALKRSRQHGFLARDAAPAKVDIRGVLRLSVPSGVQGLFFAGGFVAFYRIADMLGTEAMAASVVLINLAMVCVLPAMGFGLAAATLVGRSLGRREPEEAAAWGWTTVGLASALLALIGAVLALFPATWLDILMDAPAAEAMAVVPMVLMALSQPLDSIGVVLMNAMVGAGYVRAVMLASLTLQWGLFLPAAYAWAVVGGGGLLALWIAMGVWRALTAVVMATLFRRGGWKSVEV